MFFLTIKKKIPGGKMKYFLLFITAVILTGCSSSKVELGSLNQDPCKNEVKLNNPKEFVGETVENLTVYQQGEQIMASMDVRTYCNSNINFDIDKTEKQIKLKLFNEGPQSSDCVCIKTVTTAINNIDEGSYDLIVTNRAGDQLLATKPVNVKD
jgi:hypothetical protein